MPLYQVTFWRGSPWASELGLGLALRLAPNRNFYCIKCCKVSDRQNATFRGRWGTDAEHVFFSWFTSLGAEK